MVNMFNCCIGINYLKKIKIKNSNYIYSLRIIMYVPLCLNNS